MEFLAEIYSKVNEIESMIKSRGYSDRIMSAVVFGLIEDSNLEDENGMVNVRSLFSYNLDSKEELEYKLLSELEADFSQGKISVTSPVGHGLLGRKAGEKVEIKVPAGTLRYKILKISR